MEMSISLSQQIGVMQGFERGLPVQFREWNEVTGCWTEWEDEAHPMWNWVDEHYRLTPIPIDVWVVVYKGPEYSRVYKSEAEAVDSIDTHRTLVCITNLVEKYPA